VQVRVQVSGWMGAVTEPWILPLEPQATYADVARLVEARCRVAARGAGAAVGGSGGNDGGGSALPESINRENGCSSGGGIGGGSGSNDVGGGGGGGAADGGDDKNGSGGGGAGAESGRGASGLPMAADHHDEASDPIDDPPPPPIPLGPFRMPEFSITKAEENYSTGTVLDRESMEPLELDGKNGQLLVTFADGADFAARLDVGVFERAEVHP
jgi:hypothetical protein